MHVASARTNLSFDEAHDAMRKGHMVRRACWITTLSWRGNRAAWNITDELARSCSMGGKNADKSYTPHPSDVDATDWEVA